MQLSVQKRIEKPGLNLYESVSHVANIDLQGEYINEENVIENVHEILRSCLNKVTRTSIKVMPPAICTTSFLNIVPTAFPCSAIDRSRDRIDVICD